MSVTSFASGATSAGWRLLTEPEAKEMLGGAGVNVVPTRLARSREEAVAIGKELGFPVVLKIASEDIIHKSDAGGVVLGLKNSRQVGQAFDRVVKNGRRHFPRASIMGAAVQKMAPPGVEVIMGVSRDSQFGPVLMFGLGGVWVEIMTDVSFRIIPVTRRDAREMIEEIKGYPLLKGYRGHEAVDIARLEDMLLAVSDLVTANPEIKELDLNPVIAYPDSAVAVDARIVLEAAGSPGG